MISVVRVKQFEESLLSKRKALMMLFLTKPRERGGGEKERERKGNRQKEKESQPVAAGLDR